MCGISGIILREGERADGDLAAAMAKDMAHRGPDAQTSFTHANFSFTHRRLKVIDTSDAANQPLFNEARTMAVVFNGEIYNFLELREILVRKGHRFQTRSDTEVVVHAYEEWGLEALSMFNGMFAIAIWDGRADRNEFLLARDKKGIKPLFYTTENQRLAFASELKPLLRMPWVSKEVDQESIYHFLKFSHVPNPSTILTQIKQLEPAHYLRVRAGQVEKQSYWSALALCQNPVAPGGLAEWEDRFEKTLHSSVRRQLVSDVPVGCFLSGGIDSSLLTMAFARAQNQRVNTFSIGYKESGFDETSHARRVANAFGADHHEVIVGPEDLRGLIEDIPTYFDLPFADPTMLPTMILSKLARRKVTVALSGDGADELFWGYDYQQMLRRLKPFTKVPTSLRKTALRALGAPLGAISDRARKLLEILQFEEEGELLQYFIGTVGPLRMDKIASLLKDDSFRRPPAFAAILEKSAGLAWEDKIAYVFQNTFLVDSVLAKTDRASMAHGLETRVPFLDDEMLALSSQMPFHMKYQMKRSKFLLRSVLAKHLPPEITQRKKQGFSVPLRGWLRHEMKYLLDDYIFSDQTKLAEWLDIDGLQKLARDHVDGRRNHFHLLWSVVCLGLWKERYINP